MKNNLLILFLFHLVALMFSCDKNPDLDPKPVISEPQIDTIKSENYYPVVPNSYWKYINPENQNGDTTHYVTTKYTLTSVCEDAINISLYPNEEYYTSSITRKKSKFNGIPVFGYYICSFDRINGSEYYKIMSETVGDGINYPGFDQYVYVQTFNTVIQKKIIPEFLNYTSDSIVVVKTYKAPVKEHITVKDSSFNLSFYGKNIGLLEKRHITVPEGDTTIFWKLIDWHIGN